MVNVNIKVDLGKREELRRLHTVTHILNYCAREVLGTHIWQNGSNLKNEIGSLDITHYENLSNEEIFKIEKLANKVIFEDRKVSVEELDRGEAERKYGFSLYQGGAIPMEKLRVVKILDNDIEACGGIHMLSTGGIGIVKIVESQKIQDGVVRIKYLVNSYALDFISKKQDLLSGIENIFSVDSSSIIRTSEKFFNDWKSQKKEIENLKSNIKDLYISSILENNCDNFKINGEFDMGFLMEIFVSIFSKKKKFQLISDKFVISSSEFDEPSNFKKKISKGKFNIFIL